MPDPVVRRLAALGLRQQPAEALRDQRVLLLGPRCPLLERGPRPLETLVGDLRLELVVARSSSSGTRDTTRSRRETTRVRDRARASSRGTSSPHGNSGRDRSRRRRAPTSRRARAHTPRASREARRRDKPPAPPARVEETRGWATARRCSSPRIVDLQRWLLMIVARQSRSGMLRRRRVRNRLACEPKAGGE